MVVSGDYSGGGGHFWPFMVEIGLVQVRPKRSKVGVALDNVDFVQTRRAGLNRNYRS